MVTEASWIALESNVQVKDAEKREFGFCGEKRRMPCADRRISGGDNYSQLRCVYGSIFKSKLEL